jgi:hypothetical protein
MKTNYHKKMAPKQEGPFKIEEVLGPVTYRLKLPITWKVYNMFYAVLLKPYIKTEVHGENFSRPVPDILDGEEVYNVETILNTEEEDNLINTWSNGKDTRSLRPRGNLKKHFLMMVICCHITKNNTNYEMDCVLQNIPKDQEINTTSASYLTRETSVGHRDFTTPWNNWRHPCWVWSTNMFQI